MGLCGGGGGGGGTVTTSSKPSKQSPLEQDILGAGSGLYQQILYDQGYVATPQPQRDFIDEIAKAEVAGDDELVKSLKKEQKDANKAYSKYGATPFTISKRELTEEEQKQKDFETSLQDQYQGMIRGDYSMDPASKKALDEYYGTAQSELERSLFKGGVAAAGSRGMGFTDTPAFNPYMRMLSEGTANISGQKAKSFLGQRAEDLNRAGNYMAYADTKKQLTGFQNPMALASGISGFGLGLYTPRFSKGTTTQTGGGTSAAGLGGLMGGAGGLMQGIGSMGGGGGGAAGGTGGCWIAAELYGQDSDEFHLARHAIFVLWTGMIARLVQRFYLRFGVRIAGFLHRHPFFKPVIKPLFDFAVAKARE